MSFAEVLEEWELSGHATELIQRVGSRDLLATLKDLGIAPMGKRMALANALRGAKDGPVGSGIETTKAQGTAAATANEQSTEANSAKEDNAGRAELKGVGNSLLAAGNLEAAIQAYRKALEISDVNEDKVLEGAIQANLSLALLKTHRLEEAVVAADSCIAARPCWAKGYYRKGQALLRQGSGMTMQATACLNEAGKLCETDRERREVAVALDRAYAAGGRGAGCDAALSDGDDTPEDVARNGDGANHLLPCRRVVPLQTPERIPASQRSRIREQLQQDGYVVVANAADRMDLAALRRLLWSHVRAFGMREGYQGTWGGEFPGPPHLGLLTWGHTGQSECLWHARTLPRVGAAFEAAWGLDPGSSFTRVPKSALLQMPH